MLGFPRARVFRGAAVVESATDPLRMDGMVFRLPDGTAWRWKAATMFRAPQRWDRGENMDGLVAWSRTVGVNTWRVFCQTSSRFGPDPIRITAPRVREFVEWAGTQGLRIEVTVLCDCEQLGQGFSAQVARLQEVVGAVAHLPNVFVECYNEPFQNSGVDFREVIRQAGFADPRRRPVLMASGDYDVPTFDGPLVLDYFTHHPGRKEDWPVESGKEGHFIFDGWDPPADGGNKGYKGAKVGVVNDEPIGCAEVRRPWSRDDRPDAFEDGGAGMAIGSAGGTFHCDDGIQALTPGPVQTECARRFFAAMDFFPPEAPTGAYTHGGYAGHPLEETKDGSIGEDACRVMPGEHVAYLVCAQPKPGWAGPRVRNGWRVAEAYPNGRGNIVKLER